MEVVKKLRSKSPVPKRMAAVAVTQVSKLSSEAKIKLIKEGISKKTLEELKKLTGLDYDALTPILSMSRQSLSRIKGEAKFNQSVSDKIVALADIYSGGYEVFQDKERFNNWMVKSNRSLGWKRPIDLLDTSYGMERVKHLIGRIAYGVFS